MSISVPPVSTNSSGANIDGTAGTTLSNNSATALGSNQFLNLMMVQLTHQDPSSPTDPSQYLGELAQFTSVEQETNTAQSTAQAASAQAVSGAVGLIGHTINYTNQTTGETLTGAVQSVQITSGGPTLTVAGVAGIAPSAVTQVS
ncbi:MAG: flagellar hook capping FlgD N-terminal domain-containing protein [Solirubrobacteraceae bacterium]|jgi:flagellar basal-body rod modification protein FlgD